MAPHAALMAEGLVSSFFRCSRVFAISPSHDDSLDRAFPRVALVRQGCTNAHDLAISRQGTCARRYGQAAACLLPEGGTTGPARRSTDLVVRDKHRQCR